MPNIAVATQNPNAVAETYVRQHMRSIAPGNTVGIAFDCSGNPPPEFPFYCFERKQPRYYSKCSSLLRFVRAGYAGALSAREERSLHNFLSDHKVERILAEFGPTAASLRKFCVNYNYRLFVNFHGYDATVMPRKWLVRFAYRKLARDVSGVICGSDYFKDKLVGLGFDKDTIHVIPCGVELDKFNIQANKVPGKIIAVGRLTEKKAPELLLRSFKIAVEQRPELKLHIIGDGPLMDNLRSLICQLGIKEKVVVRGALSHDEVIRELATAEVFVQHSVTAPNGDQESQGISLLEAMASRLPVVVTNHNGFSETVLNGKTGLLSPEGDIRRMAENILMLVGNPSLAGELGDAGRKRASECFASKVTNARLRRLVMNEI